MTIPNNLTFRVKPADNGEFLLEVVSPKPKEPTIVEMPYTCMPGGRRRTNTGEGGPKFIM